MIGLELSLQCEERHRAEFTQALENLSRARTAIGSCLETRVSDGLRRPKRCFGGQWWKPKRELQARANVVLPEGVPGRVLRIRQISSVRAPG